MNASLLRRSIADNFPINSTAVPTLTMSQISQRVARLRLLNSSSDRKTSWANPEASIGDFCRSMGRSQCWHAKGPARDLFIRLAAEVKTYLDRNCEPPTRELHWSLYMIGQTKSTARPVLMFICEDGNARRSARKTIKDSGILLRYPGVDTADCSYPPDFGQLVQLALRRNMDDLEDLTHAGSFSMDTEESYYSNFTHPVFSHRRIRSGRAVMGGFGIPSDYGQLAQQPVFEDHKDGLVIKPGKSETSVFYRPTDSILGSHVFLEDSRGNTPTSRKATAGVIVKLGDKICFLTAAHAFISRRPPSDSCPPFEYDIDGESDSDDEEFLQTIRQGSRSPLSEQSNWGLGESEKSISRSSSSQESELDTEETVTGRVTTDPTATGVATSTTHNSFQQTLDDSTHHRRRHSPRGSRSPSHSRARFSTSDGLGAAAFTGAVALARNNSQDGSRNDSRYRGRSQSRGGDTASRLESRIEYMPAVSSTGPATAGLIERARSKSRSRSKSRIKQVAHASAQERPLESGTLLASSIEGSEKGLDYALIKIEGSYISMRNQLRFNNGIFDLTLNLTRISDARPKDAKIVAITGSSGYLSGRLLGTPSFSRASDQDAQMPSQELWTVKFDGKLKEGDCGTCVFDAQTGDFYGHVVAGNRDSGYAYIVPAYQIREDLARRLGENLQFYAPAIYLLYQKLFTLADRLPIRNNESQLQRSRRESSQTTSDNVYKPVSSETRKSHTPNFLERHSRDASHGAALVRKGSEYFTPGRIFVVRWSEPIKALRTKASSNSEDISVINGQPMISYWRRMVVIKTSQAGNSSTCVGMFTYGGQGLARPGLDLDKHALVFDERLDEPRTRPDEPSLKGPPLAVCMESPFEKLDPMYRINFGVTYTVEHNMEIRDVGHIAEGSMKNFETYVAEALKTN